MQGSKRFDLADGSCNTGIASEPVKCSCGSDKLKVSWITFANDTSGRKTLTIEINCADCGEFVTIVEPGFFFCHPVTGEPKADVLDCYTCIKEHQEVLE